MKQADGTQGLGVPETIDVKARMREVLETIARGYDGDPESIMESYRRMKEIARGVLAEIEEAEHDHERRRKEVVEFFRAKNRRQASEVRQMQDFESFKGKLFADLRRFLDRELGPQVAVTEDVPDRRPASDVREVSGRFRQSLIFALEHQFGFSRDHATKIADVSLGRVHLG